MKTVCLVSFVLSLSTLVRADVFDHESAWNSRRRIPEFSLGPAPFPDHSQMDWELFGDAFSRENHIEVTPAKQHKKGAIFAKKPNIKNAKEFQAELNFKVGGGPSKTNFFGDGFALWYITERGVGGDALGGPNRWVGLGIFFDTYKNQHFKGKRHPYVYGIVNDGNRNYVKVKSEEIKDQACHIPFRNDDPNILDETVARVTYKDKIVSVVMQPKGAIDWVQCFQIKEVDLPTGGYFGITAMTGDLVDEHLMVKFALYNNIENQPFTYAHENDIRQMPQMWQDMRESGNIAREFEEQRYDNDDWLEDDLHFDPSDYYGVYGAYQDYHDYYGEGEDDDDDVPKRQEHRGGKQKGGKLDLDVSPEEMRDINDLFGGTDVVEDVLKSQNEINEKLRKVQAHVEGELKELSERVSSMIRRIRHKESELDMRVQKLASRLHVEIVDPFEREVKKTSSGWFWPFLFILSVLGGIAYVGFSKYKRFMKTHLL